MKAGDELLDVLTACAAVARTDTEADVIFVCAMGDNIMQAVQVSERPPNTRAWLADIARYCAQTIVAIDAGRPYDVHDPRLQT